MSEGLKITGLAELHRALQQLPVKVENNILRGALRAGAKVLASQAKENIHTVSGDLAASIRYGCKTQLQSGKLVATVSAGKAKKGQKNKAFYAHMVEHGTAAHVIKARKPNRMLAIGVAQVQHPGSQKRPFMRPALDQHGQAAVERVREYIRARLLLKHGIDVPEPIDPQAEPDE
jgi:HK97 gp10 family phage protein